VNAHPLLAVAEQVAAALGDGWYAAPGRYDHSTQSEVWLHGPDQAAVRISTQTWRTSDQGRLFIYGGLPDGCSWPWSMKDATRQISVADTKTPEQITRDITRRLLPTYLEGLALAIAQRQARDAEVAATYLLAEQLARTCGSAWRIPEARYWGKDRHVFVSLGTWGEPVHGRFDLPMTGDVTLEARIDREHLVELAEFLAALRARTTRKVAA
jgi:hypothetical protein